MNTFEPIQLYLVFMPKKGGKRQIIDYDEFVKIANLQLDICENHMYTKETPCDLILFPSNNYSVAVIRNNEYTKMRLISKNAGDWYTGYLRKLLVARNLSDFEFNRIIGWINRGRR